MDCDNYDHKIDSLLSDQTYSRLRCDHTKKIERQVQNHLKALGDKGEIESETYRKLTHHTKPPYLYGQPKIHKPGLSYTTYSLYPYQTPLYPIPTSVTYYFFFTSTSIHDSSSEINYKKFVSRSIHPEIHQWLDIWMPRVPGLMKTPGRLLASLLLT